MKQSDFDLHVRTALKDELANAQSSEEEHDAASFVAILDAGLKSRLHAVAGFPGLESLEISVNQMLQTVSVRVAPMAGRGFKPSHAAQNLIVRVITKKEINHGFDAG